MNEEKKYHDCYGDSEQSPLPEELKILKNEILKEVGESKERKINWASGTMTIILIVFALISITQTVQMVSLWKKIQNGAVKSANVSTGNASSLPSNLQNLPDMVGGC